MVNLSYKTKGILAAAREKYGNNNQILVAMEELCELATVCAKYPRYTDEAMAKLKLKESAIDELADVAIVFEHIQVIFGVTDKEIEERAMLKAGRLNRWLHDSDSMQATTEDRELIKSKGSKRPKE